MNKKGFTLVEIIAMMVVIGILMAITIPNISGIIKKNRESQAIEDINKMVGNAKAKLDSGKIKPPYLNSCLVFTLKSLDTNDDIGTGLNGGTYDPYETIVVVTREPLEDEYYENATSSYKYYIHLYEEKKEGNSNKIFMTRREYDNPALIDYDDFVKNPSDYFPTSGNYNEKIRTRNYEEEPGNMGWRINSMSPEGYLCDEVLGVYIK